MDGAKTKNDIVEETTRKGQGGWANMTAYLNNYLQKYTIRVLWSMSHWLTDAIPTGPSHFSVFVGPEQRRIQ